MRQGGVLTFFKQPLAPLNCLPSHAIAPLSVISEPLSSVYFVRSIFLTVLPWKGSGYENTGRILDIIVKIYYSKIV